MTTFFISDLHLSQTRPEKIELFQQLLQGPALDADALYILGDLFENFWIGVDDPRAPNKQVLSLLRDYTVRPGTHLVMMRGNRDFHIDHRFAEATGCELVEDPQLINLDGERVLLMHGDTLCSDDVDYQKWRKFIANPFIRWLNLHLPFSLRQRIATGVREYTVEATEQKLPEITDVTQATVVATMQKHNVLTLIHGHTHRQAMHDVTLESDAGRRIVLGDWYEKDCVLVKDSAGFRFERVVALLDNA
ncbi:MAG: UDP-2,3-diacylglucosamine diphosphatase [Gammaproteobacteria bacterium]